MKKSVQYDWLDLIRGLAAIAVFIGHLRIICFRDANIGDLNLLGKATFFLTGFGHISVILFFVLSGFLIIKSIHGSVVKENWTVSEYAKNRLYRLWVVLIPCLFLGLLFDKLGLTYWGDSFFYSNKWQYFLNQDLANKLSADIFIGNVFFVQKILVPTLGSNGALWSLANEFWYYVIFPLLYFASIRFYAPTIRVISGICAILLLVFVGYQISITFPIWLMGGLSYVLVKTIPNEYLQRRYLLWCTTLLFLGTVLMLRLKLYPGLFNNYSTALMFALLIPFIIQADMKNKVLRAVSNYLSNISYTIYLAHLPFIYLVTSIFGFQDKLWNNSNFLIFAAVTTATVLYATLLWYIFERNTKRIKDWMSTKRIPFYKN